MATTTYAAVRDLQVTAIRAITPTSHSAEKFIPVLAETDIRVWAEANKQACFRRFDIAWLSEERDGPVLDAERVHVNAEIVVAYPANAIAKYGADNRRDLQDLIEQDRKSVEKAAGVVGYPNLTVDASVYRSGWSVEKAGSVWFAVVEYTVAFSRATGL